VHHVRRTAQLACLTVALWWLIGPAAARLPLPHDTAAARILVDDPVELAMTALRASALAGTVYLLTLTTLASLARITRLRLLDTVVDHLCIGLVRRFVAGTAGLTLSLAGVAPVGAALLPRPAATAAGQPTADPPVATSERGRATLRLVPPATATMRALRHDPEVTVMAPEGPPPLGASPAEWVVAPGDHFWSIAERVLHDAWGRPPDDREIARYWRVLVDVNRSRLADARHPDLVFVGQRFVVPPVPS